MGIRQKLLDFISSQLGVDPKSHMFDEEIVIYLGNVWSSCDAEELDIEELASMCEAYIPELCSVQRSDLYSWLNLTRSAFLAEEKGTGNNSIEQSIDASLGISEDAPSPSLSLQQTSERSNDLTTVDQLTQLFPKMGCKTAVLKNGVNVDEQNADNSPGAQGTDDKMSAEERMSFFERYGFVSADRSSRSTGPIIPKWEDDKKSTVRYLDGKVVDTKGKKYLEIKPEHPNMPQATFLKALKRYKKH